MAEENTIEIALSLYARQAGFTTRKVRWIGRVGAPDRVVLLPGGRVVWVELKARGEKPRASQVREHLALTAYGQRVEVIDSAEKAKELIRRLQDEGC